MAEQQTAAASGSRKKWYQAVPDPMVLIFIILVATYFLTFIIPAGEFERVTQDGRTVVVPGSFAYLEDVANIPLFNIFVAIPEGLSPPRSIYLSSLSPVVCFIFCKRPAR